MDNISQQTDEIEALQAIYDDKFVVESENGSYSYQLSPETKLYISLTSNYPSNSAPTYELTAPSLNAKEKAYIAQEFREIHGENWGNPIIYQWIERLKEILEQREVDEKVVDKRSEVDASADFPVRKSVREFDLKVTHGETIVDRKSVFQGHACVVNSQEDVISFKDYLMENKKIAQATHNISAYKIILPNKVVLQDCDDDGENHAGGRLLHLLQLLNVSNIMVVVSRWYGGIQLGPDRFKHINNAARQVLLQCEAIK